MKISQQSITIAGKYAKRQKYSEEKKEYGYTNFWKLHSFAGSAKNGTTNYAVSAKLISKRTKENRDISTIITCNNLTI